MADERQQIESGTQQRLQSEDEDAGHTAHAQNEQWGPRRAGHQEEKQC